MDHLPGNVIRSFAWFLILCSVCGHSFAQTLYYPPVSGTTWDTLSPASLNWYSTEIDTLYDYLEQTNTRGFIVLKDGKIVLEKYFGTFTTDSLWYWASAGKSLTACLVGIARQEGYLDLDDTTAQYLGQGWTSCPAPKEAEITIRNQLTMTTGLDDAVPDPYCTIDTCLQYLADAGTRWAYHNAPYTLLDDVIQAATGQTVNNYFIQKIGLTTGIAGLYVPSGYNHVFISNARSMARFGLLILSDGIWDGTPVISDPLYFSDMVHTSQNLNLSYGYLWWLNGKPSFMVPGLQFVFPGSFSPDAPSDMFAALGKNGQLVNVVPSQNLVMIRMGDAPGTGEVPFTYNDSVWVYLNRVICSSTAVQESAPGWNVKLYPNPATDHITIAIEGQTILRSAVCDLAGRQLLVSTVDSSLSLAGLSAGPYYIRCETDQGVFFRRFIKR